LLEAAEKYKVATQMGNQGYSNEGTRQAAEMIWAGEIGNVTEVHAWTNRPIWPQGMESLPEEKPVPDTLDWEVWLGPAPTRPYHPAYLPFKWRGWWDFGTGALGDIGCHSFDPVFRALKLGAPLSVEASSTRVNEETYPLASMVTYQFPARGDLPAVKLTWYDGGLRPPRPAELEDGQALGDTGRLLIGDKGKILGNKIIPESRRKEYGEPPPSIPRSAGHYKEWIEACKGGQPGGSNFNWAGPLAETVLLGNVALRSQLREDMTRQKLLWDAPNLRITNSPEANQYLRREYRNGWSLG